MREHIMMEIKRVYGIRQRKGGDDSGGGGRFGGNFHLTDSGGTLEELRNRAPRKPSTEEPSTEEPSAEAKEPRNGTKAQE
jgi:hypothetical protein